MAKTRAAASDESRIREPFARPTELRDGLGLIRRKTECFGVCPAVVLGQDLTGLAGLVGDGPVTDLAARDRKLRNRHGKAAGA